MTSVIRLWHASLSVLLGFCVGVGGDLDAGDIDMGVFLEKNCLGCHSKAKHKGDVVLEGLAKPGADPGHDAMWDNIRNALAESTMPPEDKPQPSLTEREAALEWIDHAFDGPDGTPPSDPGWVAARRLARIEFNNTVRDLLGVGGTPADALPSDASGGHGSFDNNTDALFISPLYLERMLDLALSLLEDAKSDRLKWPQLPDDVEATVGQEAATQALKGWLPLAWRRPVSDAEISDLVQIYVHARVTRKLAHPQALRLAYATALASPHFLYRIELQQPMDAPYALGAFELANRLSYFLWATMPDARLFAKAKDGSLLNDNVLKQEVARMVADSKAKTFAHEFMGQWLGTHRLATGEGPDQLLFKKDYTQDLRYAMIDEPGQFFLEMLRTDAPLSDLIRADYLVVNQVLAKHYGLDFPVDNTQDKKKRTWERIAVSDGRRGGVVTMAGVLAVTSRPARTSPVIRGTWILDELLSYPPPPPPMNVPGLDDAKDKEAATGSLRQRLEQHRDDPNCRGCHQRIDPLGFGLENFDALGRWRDQDANGAALDASGTMPSGETFSGPGELKAVLMKRHERVMTTVIERMLAYALGRNLARHDRATVRQIHARLAAYGWRSQALVEAIALSLPFRYARIPTVAANDTPAKGR